VSSWGNSWGYSWGNSWGALFSPPAAVERQNTSSSRALLEEEIRLQDQEAIFVIAATIMAINRVE